YVFFWSTLPLDISSPPSCALVSRIKFTLPLKFLSPAAASKAGTFRFKVWCGKIAICGSVAECGEPPGHPPQLWRHRPRLIGDIAHKRIRREDGAGREIHHKVGRAGHQTQLGKAQNLKRLRLRRGRRLKLGQ